MPALKTAYRVYLAWLKNSSKSPAMQKYLASEQPKKDFQLQFVVVQKRVSLKLMQFDAAKKYWVGAPAGTVVQDRQIVRSFKRLFVCL